MTFLEVARKYGYLPEAGGICSKGRDNLQIDANGITHWLSREGEIATFADSEEGLRELDSYLSSCGE